jgi:RimJ/RimL family protein N-acetyltransferase
VNLRVIEKEDLQLFAEWANNPEVLGESFPLLQRSRTEIEKALENNPFEPKIFIMISVFPKS